MHKPSVKKSSWGKTFFEKKGASRTGKNPPNPLSKKLLTLAISMFKVKSFLALPFFQKR